MLNRAPLEECRAVAVIIGVGLTETGRSLDLIALDEVTELKSGRFGGQRGVTWAF